MPRTASATSNGKTAPRGRKRSRPTDERPPVLFRLPEVQLQLQPPEPLEESDVDGNSGLPDAAVTDSALTTVTSDVVSTPSPGPSSPSDSTRASAVDALAVESTRMESTKSLESVTDSQNSLESEPARTWWEHWSSGVVLILLVIALIAASVIAFNDSGAPDPDLLANVGQSEISLDELSIPDGIEPFTAAPESQSPAVPIHQAAAQIQEDKALAESHTAGSAKEPNRLHEGLRLEASTVPSPAAVVGTVSESETIAPLDPTASFDVTHAGSPETQVVDAESSLIPTLDLGPAMSAELGADPSGDEGLATAVPADGSQPTGEQAGGEQVAGEAALRTANLLAPHPVQQKDLFSEDNQLQVTSSGNESVEPGASPAFYDGANATANSEIQREAGNAGYHDTKMPSYESLLSGARSTNSPYHTVSHQASPPSPSLSDIQSPPTGSVPPLPSTTQTAVAPTATSVPGTPLPQSNLPPASRDATAGTSSVGPSVSSQATPSATPEQNTDALLRAYQEFRQLNLRQTQDPTGQNRYMGSPGVSGTMLPGSSN